MFEKYDHYPDRWVILQIVYNGETYYKVLGGWSGSYLNGQSWRLNSGIKKVENCDDHFLIHSDTGSVYKCNKDSYGYNLIMLGVLETMIEKFGEAVKQIDLNAFTQLEF